MKTVISIGFVALLTVCGSTTHARTVWTEGAVDCGLWLTARKANSASHLEHYSLGLINGMALGTTVDIWGGTNGIKVNREQFYFWMDAWCQNNPLNFVHIGADDFANTRTDGAWKNRPLSK